MPSERLNRLSRLFVQRAAKPPAEGMRILENVLEDRHADVRAIAAAVTAATEAEAVELEGAGIGETISHRQGLKRLDAITVENESTE